jgi:hypothetical protein
MTYLLFPGRHLVNTRFQGAYLIRTITVDRFMRELATALGVRYSIIGIPHHRPTPRFAERYRALGYEVLTAEATESAPGQWSTVEALPIALASASAPATSAAASRSFASRPGGAVRPRWHAAAVPGDEHGARRRENSSGPGRDPRNQGAAAIEKNRDPDVSVNPCAAPPPARPAPLGPRRAAENTKRPRQGSEALTFPKVRKSNE